MTENTTEPVPTDKSISVLTPEVAAAFLEDQNETHASIKKLFYLLHKSDVLDHAVAAAIETILSLEPAPDVKERNFEDVEDIMHGLPPFGKWLLPHFFERPLYRSVCSAEASPYSLSTQLKKMKCYL